MNKSQNYLYEIAIRSIITLFCCLVIGYIFYQSLIFNIHTSPFSFLVFGIIGSIFFYSLRVNIRNAFATFLLLFIVSSAMVTHSTKFNFLLRDILYYGALASAVYIFFQYFYNKGKKDRWLEPLILSVLIAFLVLFAFLFSLIINKAFSFLTFSFIFTIAKMYFLIGLGIGIGIFITEEPFKSRILNFLKLKEA